MKHFQITVILLLSATLAFAQKSNDPAFEKMLKNLIDFTVPTVSVKTLKNWQQTKTIYLLDAREKVEYNVSHIKDAQYIGYERFSKKSLKKIPKNSIVVLYCSVGYRSGKLVQKLQKMGYKNAYNLHGSIFEWVNQGNPVVDKKGKPTKQVHTYNKDWSKWLKRGKKVY